jgi:hypothetical protein
MSSEWTACLERLTDAKYRSQISTSKKRSKSARWEFLDLQYHRIHMLANLQGRLTSDYIARQLHYEQSPPVPYKTGGVKLCHKMFCVVVSCSNSNQH